MERVLETRKLLEVEELGVDRNASADQAVRAFAAVGGGQDREVDPVSAGSAALPDGPGRSGVGSLLSAGPAEVGCSMR